MNSNFDTNNPYEVLTKLRDNKLLFKYLEKDCNIEFSNDLNNWVIVGYSNEGEFCASVLSSGLLRLEFPIPIPRGLPLAGVGSIAGALNGTLEGMLIMGEYSKSLSLKYMAYTTTSTLDIVLEQFYREKNSIEDSFNKMFEVIETMSRDSKVDNLDLNKNKNENPWAVINEIDKQSPDQDDDDDDDND